MPAKIQGSIPPQNIEVIRDKIAAILVLEMANQWVLDPTVPKIKSVQKDAFVPDNMDTQANFINVSIGTVAYDNETVQKTTANPIYYIDVFAIADTTVSTGPADEYSARITNRIAGMVRSILAYPDYADLDLPGLVGYTSVIKYTLIDRGVASDALSGVVGRLQFEVNTIETNELTNTERAINELTCTINIEETPIGFFYDYKQANVTVVTTGDTLTNAFFSNPIMELTNNTTGAAYRIDVDYTQVGTTLTAASFTFTAGEIYKAKTD